VQKRVGEPPPQYPIESVDNALRLLLLLGERPEIRLSEVSAELGVASSTAHRILAMLMWRGFARQDVRNKAYAAGPALTNVAFSIFRRMDLPRFAQPILEDLSLEMGETSHLGTLEGANVRFIAASEPIAAVRVASRLGREIPAHATSTGKAMLAGLSPEALRRLFPSDGLEPVTEHTVRTFQDLEHQLDQVRRDGYASNREESEDGVASVAVPVTNSAGLNLALNLSAPVHRLPAGKVRAFSRALKDAALRLSEILG
jgi:DNA-binding IclR family transcriptional regulator